MEPKDIVTVILSVVAVVISLASLLISLKQKERENTRLLRTQLSDTLNQISALGVAFAKLKLEAKGVLTNDIIDVRRNYTTQRTSLLNYAEFLTKENPQFGNDITYSILATNWNYVSNFNKASENWELAIQASEDLVIKHTNLRGFANFLFFQGNMVAGRGKYSEALALRLPDTDNVKRIIADTYLMWARIEMEFGFNDEYPKLLTLANHSCDRISNIRMRNEMQTLINSFYAVV